MKGPFPMTEVMVRATIPPEPGVYVLGNAKNGALFVGRADSNLREQLLAHFSPQPTGPTVAKFWFEITGTQFDAFITQCRWYHQFSPTHNAVHPSIAGMRCPICGR